MAKRDRLAARRKAQGFTQESLARELDVTTGTVAHWEQGTSNVAARHRTGLAVALDWSPEHLTVVLDEQPSPGHPVPHWLTLYASLEQSAGAVCAWQPYTVHALLQTEGYAHAVESHGPGPVDSDTVAQRVDLRLGRQVALTRGLRLSVVLDESVLLRRTGGREVMAEQLDYLSVVAALPNVDVRVLPLDAGIHSAAFGTFTTLTATGADSPFLACIEHRAGTQYLEDAESVAAHDRLFTHLQDHALGTNASRDLIVSISKEYQ